MYFYIKKEYFFNHYDQVYLEMVETSSVNWVFHDKEMIIGSFHSRRSAQFFIMVIMVIIFFHNGDDNDDGDHHHHIHHGDVDDGDDDDDVISLLVHFQMNH